MTNRTLVFRKVAPQEPVRNSSRSMLATAELREIVGSMPTAAGSRQR